MSTQYRLVQSGKTASGGCSAGQGSSEPVAPRIIIIIIIMISELRAIVSLNAINQLIVEMERSVILFEVRTECFAVIQISCMPPGG
jgi:hypothetical protein